MGILLVPSYQNRSTFRTLHKNKYYMMPSPLSLLIILASTITYTKASPVFGPDRVYFSKYHDISAFTSRNSKGIAETPRAAPRSADIGDVVDVAVGAGSFSTLVKIVTDLGLVPTLKGVDAVTIFAPSDEAFAKLPAGTLESLTPEQKKAIVSRHVVAGASVYASDVATGCVETFGGENVRLVKTAKGGVEVFYNGQAVNVVTADVKGSNGVIHVIDEVILGKDVVDVAVGAGAFTTLVKIVRDLGLVPTLKEVDSVTIFAPSDEAFKKLPEGTLESLTTEQAKAIVSRHVVPGNTVYAADVTTGSVGTFGGDNIDLIKNDSGVQVSYNGNAVNVVSADVKANNGVIHVIDAVIL